MKLTTAGQTVLQKKVIGQYYRFYIDDVVNNDVIDYQFSYNLEFSSASLEIELENSDGRYSPDGSSEITIGAVGELKEGLLVSGSYEVFSKFKGILRQRQYSKVSGKNKIKLFFLDYIVKLQEMDIGGINTDQIFESPKVNIKTVNSGFPEILTANALVGTGWTDQAQVFDFANPTGSSIAPTPEPIVRILRKEAANDSLGQPAFSGYEINYETNQLTLNIPININNYKVVVDYWYYTTGTYVEDWIEDIIIQTDIFANTPFTAATNLRTTYQAEEGTGITDTMTPNTSNVTIGVTVYPPGQIWYLDYDNVQTTLVEADFTLNGISLTLWPGWFDSFDARFGRLILKGARPITDEMICTNNYQFSTLQATGIYVPYIDLTTRSVANRFEAIKKLKELLAPNYIISTKGSNKIWGRYLADKTTADYTLRLETSLNYAEDIKDIYTRVKLYGQSNSPTNLMVDINTVFTKGVDYTVHVDELVLSPEGSWQGDNWFIYGASTLNGIMTIDTSKPIQIWFDDIKLGGANAPTERTFSKVHVSNTFTKTSGQSEWGIYFEDADIVWDNSHPITFYDTNGTNTYVLDRTNLTSDSNGVYYYANTSPAVPVKLNIARGYWQIPESMNNNRRYLFLGQSQPFNHIQALVSTTGHNYSLRYENYNDAGMFRDGDARRPHDPNWGALGMHSTSNGNIGRYELWTEKLTSWDVRSPELPININFDNWSFHYTDLWSWYASWGSLYDWVPCTINGSYMYWICIWTTTYPTSIAYISKMEAILADWTNEAHHLPITKVFTYRADTQTFTDYTEDCANGTANMPLLEVGTFHESTTYAKYWVFHGSDLWQIPTIDPYNKQKFALIYSLFAPEDVKSRSAHIVKATFDYKITSLDDVDFSFLKDGDPNTQWQLELASPLAGTQILFTVDFGSLKDIDAIDITAGFFNPDDPNKTGFTGTGARRYDIKNWYSIQYSSDNITYNYINKETYNFLLSGGESKSFENDILGEGFQARYIRLIAEQVSMVDFGNGRWVISIVDFSVWQDIIIKADAKLGAANVLPTTTDATSTVADPDNLRTTIGEKVYKVNEINKNSMTKYTTGMRAYNLLAEYVKNATRASVEVAYSPHLELGQTVQVVDSVNGVSQNYFIEGISNSKGAISLQLAYYP